MARVSGSSSRIVDLRPIPLADENSRLRSTSAWTRALKADGSVARIERVGQAAGQEVRSCTIRKSELWGWTARKRTPSRPWITGSLIRSARAIRPMR